MKTLLTKTTLLGILFFVSSSPVIAQSDAELKSKIEKMNLEMGNAMVAGDMEKSHSFYANDVISLPNYQPILTGIDAIRKSSEEMKKAGWSVTGFKTKTVSVSSCNNLVTEIGTYEITFAVKGNDQPMTDVGKYLTIWEKQSDGSMKIKIETWNTDKYPVMAEKK